MPPEQPVFSPILRDDVEIQRNQAIKSSEEGEINYKIQPDVKQANQASSEALIDKEDNNRGDDPFELDGSLIKEILGTEKHPANLENFGTKKSSQLTTEHINLTYAANDEIIRQRKALGGSVAIQASLHLRLNEARLRVLEDGLRDLKIKVENLPDDFDSELNKNAVPIFRLEICRSRKRDFTLTMEKIGEDTTLKPVLEVLLGTSFAKRQLKNEIEKSESSLVETGSGETDRSLSLTKEPVERLRIRSQRLITHLEDVTNSQIYTTDETEDDKCSVVFLRPFKLFMKYESEIRQSLVDYTEKLRKRDEGETDSTNDTKTDSATSKDTSNGTPTLGRQSSKREAIKKERTAQSRVLSENQLLKELQLLIQFFDEDLKDTLTLRQEIKDGTATLIEYADLWHLFEADEAVLKRDSPTQIYRVIKTTRGRDPLIAEFPGPSSANKNFNVAPLDAFLIDCYFTAFNGASFGHVHKTFHIPRYEGLMNIQELPIFPLKFHENHEEMIKKVAARGSKMIELAKLPFAHKMYIGMSFDEPVEQIDSQVIIDVTLAVQKNPEWNPTFGLLGEKLSPQDTKETYITSPCKHQEEACCGGDFVHKDLKLDNILCNEYMTKKRGGSLGKTADHLTEEDFLVLSNFIYGFVLLSRKWAILDIMLLQDVPFNSNFEDLVLPHGYKKTVMALVKNHSTESLLQDKPKSSIGPAMDLVRGKGRGLIILLHGEPGVGKTSTAECVADYTKRPLFPITCGDIGETAMSVQTNLDINFQLASKWGCVLLLDEADVFLQRRDKVDLSRNAVVSVFLRTLEYYGGILFLTTNRVGTFDTAFKSRIHMSLYFPKLDLTATLQIYKVLLKRVRTQQKEAGTEFRVNKREIMEFAISNYKELDTPTSSTWNGRQIRNAFQTAIALIEYEARLNQDRTEQPTLGRDQFELVAKTSKEFDQYLRDTIGGTDAEIAQKERVRYHRFNTDEGKIKQAVEAQHSITGANSQQSTTKTGAPRRRNAPDPESDLEIDVNVAEFLLNDSDDFDDRSDSDEDVGKHKASNPVKLVSGKSKAVEKPETLSVEAGDEDDDYAQFLEFKRMKQKNATTGKA